MDFKINKDGYIVTKAKMASIDPMEYLGEEIGEEVGKIYKVFRDESEVFSPETIASFEGKPLTLTHPSSDVNAKNWKSEAIGHIQNVRREGKFLVGDVYINDETAIQIIKEYGIKEVSCGYESRLIKRDGKIWQTNIRGNHLAVVAKGRAGKECKLGDKKGSNMNFKDRLKELLGKTKSFKLKDGEGLEKEQAKEIINQSNELVEILQEALNGAEEMSARLDETSAELQKAKAEITDLKKTKDNDENQNAEVADLKARIEALSKENEELKAEIQRLKNEGEAKDALQDAKANFSKIVIKDAKSARAIYAAVILDSKAFSVDEIEKLSDGEIKAIYLGMKASKNTKDNSSNALNQIFDAKVEKIDLNKKFGGR